MLSICCIFEFTLQACDVNRTQLHISVSFVAVVYFTDFVSLNLQLDELSSALDALERKNDHIHAQLMKLLESNRETRQQFQEKIANEQK
jgi:hypothetical protein